MRGGLRCAAGRCLPTAETSVAAVAGGAEAEGVASATLDADLVGQVRASALMWEPRYRPVRPA